jgi:hypothetical protein
MEQIPLRPLRLLFPRDLSERLYYCLPFKNLITSDTTRRNCAIMLPKVLYSHNPDFYCGARQIPYLTSRSSYTCETSGTKPWLTDCISGTSHVFAIQIRWKSSDISSFETDPMVPGSTIRAMSSTKTTAPVSASSTDHPSASDSRGTKIAIGIAVPIGILTILAGAFLFWLRKRKRTRAVQQQGSGVPEINDKQPPPAYPTDIVEVPAQSARLPGISELRGQPAQPRDVNEAYSRPIHPQNVAEASMQPHFPTSVAEMSTEPFSIANPVEAPTEQSHSAPVAKDIPQRPSVTRKAVPAEMPAGTSGSATVLENTLHDGPGVEQPKSGAVASSTDSQREQKINQLKQEQARLQERRKRLIEFQKLDVEEEALRKQLEDLEGRGP